VPHIIDSRAVLAVQDLATSTRFYTDVLGFRRDPVDAKGWSFLSRDSFKLMLGECADEIAAGETGNHSWFVRLTVEGLDEYHREIASRGAEVIAEPADKRWGLREFVIRTPDGHRIMFSEPVGKRGEANLT
jgi:catechol 2,3-dioxygenase-like lactoylglutathione lyase family enzyme